MTVLEFPGLREWLFPSYRSHRNLVVITGERSVYEGVSEPDRSGQYQRPPDHILNKLSDPRRTRGQLREDYNGRDLEVWGGIPNVESWATLFLTADYPYTLVSLQRDIETGHSMPIVYDYPNAVRRRVEGAENSVREVHGFDSSNYLSMPHTIAREMGRGNNQPKDPNMTRIRSPDWELWRVHPDGSHDVLHKSTPVPFDRGEGSFLIYAGPSVFDPSARQYLAIGDRAPSTEAANALYFGRKTWERERKLADGTIMPPDRWAIEGAERIAGEIWSYIETRTLPYHGLQVAAQVLIDQQKVWRIGELLDIEFIRFEDSKPQRVFAAGTLDLSKLMK